MSADGAKPHLSVHCEKHPQARRQSLSAECDKGTERNDDASSLVRTSKPEAFRSSVRGQPPASGQPIRRRNARNKRLKVD